MSAAPCLPEPQQYEVQFGRLRNFLTGKYREARKRKLAASLPFQQINDSITKFKIMAHSVVFNTEMGEAWRGLEKALEKCTAI